MESLKGFWGFPGSLGCTGRTATWDTEIREALQSENMHSTEHGHTTEEDVETPRFLVVAFSNFVTCGTMSLSLNGSNTLLLIVKFQANFKFTHILPAIYCSCTCIHAKERGFPASEAQRLGGRGLCQLPAGTQPRPSHQGVTNFHMT